MSVFMKLTVDVEKEGEAVSMITHEEAQAALEEYEE